MGNFSNYWDLTTLFTKLKNKLKSISDKIDESVSLKTATGNPITLTDAANANAKGLLMAIEPIQSGSGDPSPTNVRPISGLASGEIQTTNGTDTNTAVINFGQTVYGGTVNFKTGEVTVTHGVVDLGDYDYGITYGLFVITEHISDAKAPTDQGIESAFCSSYKHYYTGEAINLSDIPDKSFVLCIRAMSFTRKIAVIKDSSYTDVTAFKTAMSGVQLCYELETPTTLTLTPAELELLKGNNTITANGAEISLSYYSDNAIGVLAGRVDDKADITYVDNAVATKADTADVNTALAGKADITTITIPRFTPSQAGWRRVCKIKATSGHTVGGVIYVGGYWSNGQPLSASVAVNIMHSSASLTLLSSTDGSNSLIRRMRLIFVSEAEYWLDVFFNSYSNSTGPHKLTITGDIAVSDIQNPISITTDATAATDEISLNQKVSGTVLTDKSLETKYLHYISIQRYDGSNGVPTYDVSIPIINNTATTMTKTEILTYLDEHGHIKPLHGMYIYRTNGNITSAEPIVDFVYTYYEGSEDKRLIFYRFSNDERALTTDASNLRIEDRFVVQIVQNA